MRDTTLVAVLQANSGAQFLHVLVCGPSQQPGARATTSRCAPAASALQPPGRQPALCPPPGQQVRAARPPDWQRAPVRPGHAVPMPSAWMPFCCVADLSAAGPEAAGTRLPAESYAAVACTSTDGSVRHASRTAWAQAKTLSDCELAKRARASTTCSGPHLCAGSDPAPGRWSTLPSRHAAPLAQPNADVVTIALLRWAGGCGSLRVLFPLCRAPHCHVRGCHPHVTLNSTGCLQAV